MVYSIRIIIYFYQEGIAFMTVIRLDREKYDYYPLCYEYETNEYYSVARKSDKNQMSLEFSRKPLKETLKFSNTDTLFQDYWQNPEAYAIEIDGILAGILELDFEEWNSRVRLTQLLVDKKYRKMGIGKALMNFAKNLATEQGYRILVLETQNTNVPAIDFYFSQGFEFCGSNVFFYSNDDIGENEVMLEMAFLID